MRWIEYVEKVLKYICILLFAALVSIVSFQVLSRLLTQKSFTVIEELSTFLLAWSTFMCAGYAARRHAHVRVEYFVNRFLPPRGRDVLNLILNILFFLLIAYTIYASFGFVSRQMKVSMVVLPFSKGFMYLSFPVGMLFLILFILDDIILSIKRIKANDYTEQEAIDQ